jgi:ABC-2 type transport system ATP-binding protein
MKQKLTLACILMHTPAVLFLDEPTTGVDPVSRRDFWKILYELLQQGVSIFISTPYMDEAERCHRVGFMNKGHLITCDTPDGLRGQMHGDLLEMNAQPQREARAVLAPHPAVRGVAVFGNLLHVWVEDAERDEPLITAALTAQGYTVTDVRRMTPGLEDVFMSLISEENNA